MLSFPSLRAQKFDPVKKPVKKIKSMSNLFQPRCLSKIFSEKTGFRAGSARPGTNPALTRNSGPGSIFKISGFRVQNRRVNPELKRAWSNNPEFKFPRPGNPARCPSLLPSGVGKTQILDFPKNPKENKFVLTRLDLNPVKNIGSFLSFLYDELPVEQYDICFIGLTL